MIIKSPLLIIDTCCYTCSIGIKVQNKNNTTIVSENLKENHAESLPKLINKAFNQTKISPQELKSVIVTSGPGSFTGIRIGLSYAKGFTMLLESKLYCISMMALLALDAIKNKEINHKNITIILKNSGLRSYYQNFALKHDKQLEINSKIYSLLQDNLEDFQYKQDNVFVYNAKTINGTEIINRLIDDSVIYKLITTYSFDIPIYTDPPSVMTNTNPMHNNCYTTHCHYF